MFTIIGDVVGSRKLSDRAGAQARLTEVLAGVNADLAPAQAFEPTIGDEFQGCTDTLAAALLAGLLLRIRLLPEIDVRCGHGHGEITVHDAERRPVLQDGPGWWSARAAIEELARRRTARSWYDDPADAPAAATVNAFLLSRDALVDRLSARGLRLLDGALCGRSQRELAADEGVSEAAVSQQFARGVGAVRDAHRLLTEHAGGATWV